MVTEFLATVDAKPQHVQAVIVPHAGLVYSGQCAAHVFKRVHLPSIVVILAPNHTGRGLPGRASLWARGAFETPMGSVNIAEQVAEELVRLSPLVTLDRSAHQSEHAIEVELPFIATLAPKTAIVPLVLAWDDWQRCETLASALVETTRKRPGEVLLLASSDMTHYEPADRAAQKDKHALTAVEALDGERLLNICRRRNITMCGRTPAATVLEAARQLGAREATTVDYRHSGWVTGDDSSVVAYAGVVIR